MSEQQLQISQIYCFLIVLKFVIVSPVVVEKCRTQVLLGILHYSTEIHSMRSGGIEFILHA